MRPLTIASVGASSRLRIMTGHCTSRRNSVIDAEPLTGRGRRHAAKILEKHENKRDSPDIPVAT